MIWSYDSLWQKTKLYVARALGEEREGPLFPFWSALALEFLARATLASVHPALLADPTDGENIMYVFGFGTTKNPKSIPAKALFLRCQRAIPGFAEQDVKFSMSMVERRNQELHSGAPVFDDLPTALWLADYFRICKMLLSLQKKSLIDLFGAEEVAAAEKMIEAANEKLNYEAQVAMAAAAKQFKLLSPEDQEHMLQSSKIRVLLKGSNARELTCPACGGSGVVHGEPVRTAETRLKDEMLVREVAILPTTFVCDSCGLKLVGHGLLHAAGLGGQFTIEDRQSPLEYYGPELDPADYYEDDYGNC
jgi:hypothetical protein